MSSFGQYCHLVAWLVLIFHLSFTLAVGFCFAFVFLMLWWVVPDQLAESDSAKGAHVVISGPFEDAFVAENVLADVGVGWVVNGTVADAADGLFFT